MAKLHIRHMSRLAAGVRTCALKTVLTPIVGEQREMAVVAGPIYGKGWDIRDSPVQSAAGGKRSFANYTTAASR